MSIFTTTLGEAVDNLTGHDEDAIEQHFGATIGQLLERKPRQGIRALIMVSLRDRDGVPIEQAKAGAQDVRVKDLDSYFVPEGEGDDPADVHLGIPLTPVGNDEPQLGTEPDTSPPSAS